MTGSHRPRIARPGGEKPRPEAVFAAMAALAPTDWAQARITAMAERMGVSAPKPPDPERSERSRNNDRLGRLAEAHARKRLRAEGYAVQPYAGGYGAADMHATKTSDAGAGSVVRYVQIKAVFSFRPSALNEAVAGLLTIPPASFAAREAWLWLYGEGWVAEIALDETGLAAVTGNPFYCEEVRRSITRALARRTKQHHQTTMKPNNRTTTTLRERMARQ